MQAPPPEAVEGAIGGAWRCRQRRWKGSSVRVWWGHHAGAGCDGGPSKLHWRGCSAESASALPGAQHRWV